MENWRKETSSTFLGMESQSQNSFTPISLKYSNFKNNKSRRVNNALFLLKMARVAFLRRVTKFTVSSSDFLISESQKFYSNSH
jgi:hypothetical protein